MRVLVRRDLECQALVNRSGAHPIELGARRLQQRQPPVARDLDGLLDPVVGVDPGGDEQSRRRDLRAQRLDDAVAPHHELAAVLAPTVRAAAAGRTRAAPLADVRALTALPAVTRGVPTRRRGRAPGRGVPLAGLSGRRGALAPKVLALLAARTRRRPLLGPGLAHRALALGVACHHTPSSRVQRGPDGVSSTAIPAVANRSRTASAAAKSLRCLASCRS